jgi:xanthine/uracil permease
MPHSFASLLVHVIFSTKNRACDLSPELAARLFPYMAGIVRERILAGVNMNRRSSIVVAVSLGLGLGVTFVPDILRALPELPRNTLASGIATGGMCALLLNAILPGEKS